MGINTDLSQILRSWGAEESTRMDTEARDAMESLRRDEQSLTALQGLVSEVTKGLVQGSSVDLHDHVLGPIVDHLKEVGVDIPFERVTPENKDRWLEHVKQECNRLQDHFGNIQTGLMERFKRHKTILDLILAILKMLHEIIMMIISHISKSH